MPSAPEPAARTPSVPPSAWVRRWSHLVAPGSRVLDVACGSGRHVRWFAARGCRVTAVDRDASALAALQGLAECVVADLEGAAWPWPGRRFDAVVVTNYLWRPRLPEVLASLDAGGVLIYETFSVGHERFGRPSNPEFLLRTAELLQIAQGLRIVAFEEGFEAAPARQVQRIAAVRTGPGEPSASRYGLAGSEDPGGQVKSADIQEPSP